MYFSRTELESVIDSKSLEEDQKMATILLDALKRGEKLTLAESKFICSRLRYLKSKSTNAPVFNINQVPECSIPVFIDKYLNYYNNVDGWNTQLDFLKNEIPLNERIADAALLNDHYQDWEKFIYGKPAKDNLLREVQIETIRQVKALQVYCQNSLLGYNRFLYLKKSIILHSKFLYLAVLGYIEESGNKEKVIKICDRKILMNVHAYVHILFRHFASIIKEHQQDKSYHFNDFDHHNLLDDIFRIIEAYGKIVACSGFNDQRIYFKINNTPYALWWKSTPYHGNKKDMVLLIETLYPVTKQQELTQISKMNEKKSSEVLSFYL